MPGGDRTGSGQPVEILVAAALGDAVGAQHHDHRGNATEYVAFRVIELVLVDHMASSSCIESIIFVAVFFVLYFNFV